MASLPRPSARGRPRRSARARSACTLVMGSWRIARRYLRTTFAFDLVTALPLDLLLILGHFLARIPIEKIRTPLQQLIVKVKALIGPFYWLIANPLVAAPFYTLQIAGMGIFGYSSAWLGMMMMVSVICLSERVECE